MTGISLLMKGITSGINIRFVGSNGLIVFSDLGLNEMMLLSNFICYESALVWMEVILGRRLP